MATTKVDIGLIDTTGTASSSTFLRGDGAWQAAGGKIVKRYYAESAAETSTTTVLNNTDSVLTISMGAQLLTLTTDTLASSSNRIRSHYGGTFGHNGTFDYFGVFLCTGATNAVHAVMCNAQGAADRPIGVTGAYEYAPGATTALTMSVRYGPADSGTTYANGASAAKWTNLRVSWLIVEEIEP